MKRIVFLNSIFLFLVFFILSAPYSFSKNESGFIFIASSFLICISLLVLYIWPYAVFSYILKKNLPIKNIDSAVLRFSPWFFVLGVISIWLVLLMDSKIIDYDFYSLFYDILISLTLLSMIFYFYLIFRISSILSSFGKENSGMATVLGYAILLFYWPVTSFVIKKNLNKNFPS